MFLNQLLEEYKESDDKEELFAQFTDRLWKSKYSFKKYKKYYTYKVKEELLSNREDLISLFNQYNKVEYTVCKSYHKDRLEHIDYIRIHINNMFGYLIDKDVYFKSEYYKSLITPKIEYFRAIDVIKSGGEVNCDNIRTNIDAAFIEADNIRMESINKKLLIKLNAYKKIINTYLAKIFDNYIPVHEYEDKYGWEMRVNVDGWSEDNYVVKYFCKSLTGYMRNYIRDSKPKEAKQKHCSVCKVEIISNGNRKKYCDLCWKEREKELKRNWWNKTKTLEV